MARSFCELRKGSMVTEQPMEPEELLDQIEERLRAILRLLAEAEEALNKAKAISQKAEQRLAECLPDEHAASHGSIPTDG
jgi:hypothetical protein